MLIRKYIKDNDKNVLELHKQYNKQVLDVNNTYVFFEFINTY